MFSKNLIDEKVLLVVLLILLLITGCSGLMPKQFIENLVEKVVDHILDIGFITAIVAGLCYIIREWKK